MRVTLRPTIAADLPFCIAESLPYRIQCITALAGGKVIGIGGLGYRPDGTVIAFAQITDEMRNYPQAIHRAGIAGMKLIRDSRVPTVLAEAQEDNPAAERWLLRLGFRETLIDGRRGFVWRRERIDS